MSVPEEAHDAPLTPRQAAAEAGRCLYCYDAPCIKGCPAGVDVPSFVKKVASENWRGALRVIREANVFGGTCARVCPAEELCEKQCSSRLLGRSIPIGALQRVAWERGMAARKTGAPGPSGCTGSTPATMSLATGKRAAIVGAGPAGLAAAYELGARGWDVTVYEASDRPGGQLDATIPAYRLPPGVVEAEIRNVLAAGVKLKTKARVGPSEAWRLLEENDAVILAAGLGGGRSGGFGGEDRPGVVRAEEFLAQARRAAAAPSAGAEVTGVATGAARTAVGKRVVVVGGGNTAMDAAVAAARAGAARVTVIYRRTAREMLAWPREYRGALAAGVEFLWLAQPVAFEGAEAAASYASPVASVKCVRMALGAPDLSGRGSPTPIPGSEFRVEADLVVMALGQTPNQGVTEAFGLVCDKGGRPRVDANGRATLVGALAAGGAVPKAAVFVAGDLGNGGATVVRAVAEGRRAALAAAGEEACPNGR